LIANDDVRKNYKKSFRTEFSSAISPHVKEYKPIGISQTLCLY
jgi:hypothetical protein